MRLKSSGTTKEVTGGLQPIVAVYLEVSLPTSLSASLFELCQHSPGQSSVFPPLIIHYAWHLDLLTQCRPHRSPVSPVFTELSAVIALFLFHFALNVATGLDLIWLFLRTFGYKLRDERRRPYEANKH